MEETKKPDRSFARSVDGLMTRHARRESVTKPEAVVPVPMDTKSDSIDKGGFVVSTATKKTEVKKAGKKWQKYLKPKMIAVCGVVFVMVLVLVVVVLTTVFNKPGEDSGDETVENVALLPSNYDTTEEEDATTKKIMDEYINIEVGELEEVEDEHGKNSAIPITVKNVSEEKMTVAIEVVALDGDGNPLDVASLYAEGIEPGQSYLFRAFELSALSDEQLRQAKYEVHKAYTYEAPTTEDADIGGDAE